MHLELGGMQRLCHNLFTSWLLESLFCMHFSLYSLDILFSRNHSWLVCQISSLQTAAGAHAEECGARGEVRAQERDSRGAAGHHLHDKMLLRSVDLMMIPEYYPSPLIRCWMSEQAEIVSVWWIVRHVMCQVRHVMMSWCHDVMMSQWHVQAGEGVSWASWSWQRPGSPHGEKLPGEWQWWNVPDLNNHLDLEPPGSRRVHLWRGIPPGRGGEGDGVIIILMVRAHLIIQVVCQTSGQWSGAMPKCVRAQGEMMIHNIKVTREPELLSWYILTNAWIIVAEASPCWRRVKF